MRIPGSRPVEVKLPQAGGAGAMLLLTAVMIGGEGGTVDLALDGIMQEGLERETLLALAYLAIREVTEHGDRTVTDWVRETCLLLEIGPDGA